MMLYNSDVVIYMFCNNWIYFYDALWLSKYNVCGLSSQTVVFKKLKLKEEVHSALSQQVIMAQSALWEKAQEVKERKKKHNLEQNEICNLTQYSVFHNRREKSRGKTKLSSNKQNE